MTNGEVIAGNLGGFNAYKLVKTIEPDPHHSCCTLESDVRHGAQKSLT